VLGATRAHAVTAVSPSLAGAERDDCAALAEEWRLRWTAVVTREMERAAYRLNDGDRCFHCKAELMDVLTPIAAADGATIVLGVNVDDLGEHRPGQRAAAAAGAAFPLVDAGFTKREVREASRRLGLRTWDKPAAACLASRVPYGSEVSVPILGRIERAEAALHSLGFAQCRVRHYDDTARIEIGLEALPRLLAARQDVVDAVRAAGYRYVTLDLEGFRSGNLNAALA
jgi:pyridinium-3,5-biscarboxylic acid mononucleotide sulfurtransferase